LRLDRLLRITPGQSATPVPHSLPQRTNSSAGGATFLFFGARTSALAGYSVAGEPFSCGGSESEFDLVAMAVRLEET